MEFGSEILAQVTRGLLGAIEGSGVDRGELLARAGLSEAAIRDPDAWVPIERHVRLGQAITRALPGENLGLRTGSRIYGDPRGAVGFVLRRSIVHGRALENFCVYLEVVNRAMQVELAALQSRVMSFVLHPELAALGHPAEALCAAWVGISRHLTTTAWSPVLVEFTHQPHGDPQEHAGFFGCPVAFGRPRSRMVFSDEAWSLPITATPHPLETLLAGIRERSLELAHGDASLARLIQALTETLTTRQFDVHGADSERARLVVARALLETSPLFVHEIAYLLGFDDVQRFEQSFLACFGSEARSVRSAL